MHKHKLPESVSQKLEYEILIKSGEENISNVIPVKSKNKPPMPMAKMKRSISLKNSKDFSEGKIPQRDHYLKNNKIYIEMKLVFGIRLLSPKKETPEANKIIPARKIIINTSGAPG